LLRSGSALRRKLLKQFTVHSSQFTAKNPMS
jgi:hypothetical protein